MEKKVTLAKDGIIRVDGEFFGLWKCENLWKNGRYDKSGNKLVHYLWHGVINEGKTYTCYSRKELVEWIMNN